MHRSRFDPDFPGTGNINADAQFADPGNGDYRLTPSSPAIDAGYIVAVPLRLTEDFEQEPRIMNGGNDGSYVVDMGADES